MAKISNYEDDFGNELISIIYEDGSAWSGLKSAYDEMIAKQEANQKDA